MLSVPPSLFFPRSAFLRPWLAMMAAASAAWMGAPDLCGGVEADPPERRVPLMQQGTLKTSKRVYQARRLAGAAPAIDGKLDETCWSGEGWAGDYVQREPYEGREPQLPTYLKILYDDKAIYVGVRAVDPDMHREAPLLPRRDEFAGDMVGIALDSYFGKRTAFEFDVTSGGSKVDLILKNDGNTDLSWNAIWDAKVDVTAEGWTAEFRIPLSQLRYGNGRDLVWGLHAWRWIRRANEESNWSLIPQDNPGSVYSFGELHGISGLPRSRRIEFVPYSSVKYAAERKEEGNPYRSGDELGINAGFDAKIGLSSDFTLDATVNPDFGQVEADPSEINLSTQETFRSERRPFFLEGRNIFDGGLDDDTFFYSRRIGHAPSLVPNSAGYVDVPEHTRIFSALKVTGRTPRGLSVGVLHSMTERAEARIYEANTGERRELVEPSTHFVVARVQNELNEGNTVVGGLFTGTLRDGTADELASLPDRAALLGFDAQHFWKDRSYFVEARGVVTRVEGAQQAIQALVTNPVHYFQRPDASHVEVDPAAEKVEGNAGRVRFGKANGGRWRYFGGVTWWSPGVDFNDVGYLRAADLVEHAWQVQFFDTTPTHWFRRRNVRFKAFDRQDYGGRSLGQEVQLEGDFSTVQNNYVWTRLSFRNRRVDPRMLRGGPSVRRPDGLPFDIYFETDSSKPTQFTFTGAYHTVFGEPSSYWRFGPGIARRISPRVNAQLSFEYERSDQYSQYAGEAADEAGAHYLVGQMDQHTLASELRLDVNFSPSASLTYFGGPFASVGRFDAFREVTNPLAEEAAHRYTSRDAWRVRDGFYRVNTPSGGYEFEDPDFSWRELRSNLVFRWEFRPGSTLYCVWSQHREDSREFDRFAGVDEYDRLLGVPPSNTFLVKLSYWFSI